jgi:DNA invertase Pin-like site-specific DNA recombinase
MITKFFLYARKSSEPDDRQTMSIEAQLYELTELANREKLTIAETFIESKSAKTPGRKVFAKMIEKIHASKEAIGILAWHPDRLARNSIDGGQIIYLIDTLKISALRFPTFWFEPTPQGLFMLQVAFGQSKYYSDNLSENIKRGIRQKLRRGEYGQIAPIGYINNGTTKNIEPDPVKSKIIQRIYKEFAEGKHSIESARHRLSFFGILGKSGKPICHSVMHFVLTNPLYTGVIVSKGESYEGKFQPLVNRATFEAVQAKLKEASKSKKLKRQHHFAASGLLKCGECGCSISAQFAKGNGGTYRYYRCTKKRGKCSQSYLREDLMQTQLTEVLQMISLPDGWAHKMLAQVDVWQMEEQKGIIAFAQTVEVKLKETEQRLDKLINAFLDETIEKSVYLQKKDELIKLKMELIQKKSDFGQKGKLWVEPLRHWLDTLQNAEKIISTPDFSKIKPFLEMIGTNRYLKDKKVGIDLVAPYSFIPTNKGLQDINKIEGIKNKTVEAQKKEGLPAWTSTNGANLSEDSQAGQLV